MKHRRGDLAGASRSYEAAIARDPLDADATCLLGVVRHEQGHSAEAVARIEQAIAIRPDVPAYHASVGLALQALGRPAEAASAFARALELDPDDAAAHANRGVVLRSLGRTDEALAHFRRAAELAPRSAAARTNLGELLLEMGRPDEALPHCQAAVPLEPRLVAAHLNLGNVFLALNRILEAAAAYFQAYQLDPANARAAAGLGLAAVRRGAVDQAIRWFRKAVAIEPDSVEFLRYLAEAAGTLKLYAEVRSCCERILAIDPDQAVAHNALAFVLQGLNRYDEARAHFEAAIRLAPEFATAHFNLGVLREDLGDLEEAEALYRRARDLDPSDMAAMARLAHLHRGDLPAADQDAIERRLTDAPLTAQERASLLFALALVHDGRGDHRRAAACLEEANALNLIAMAQRACPYDIDGNHRHVDRIIEAFSPGLFDRLAGAGLRTRRPVFVIGLPRSGTTLIEQVLASHPEVHGAGEVAYCRWSHEAIPAIAGRDGDPLDAVAALDPASLRELARRHEQRLIDADGGRARRVISKMPEDYFYLGLIALLFPDAVVIHCRRDLRDVAFSCWITNFTEVPWASDPAHIAARFEDYLRLMDHWRGVLPPSFAMHEIDYEEAVDDLEGVARRLLAAMGLEWDPACLEFHRTRRPVKTASQVQVRKPVYRGSVGRWRNYRDELAGLFARLPDQAEIRSDRHAER